MCETAHCASDLLTTSALLWAIGELAARRQFIRLADTLPALVELGLHAVAVRLAVSKQRSLQVGGDVPRLGVSDQLVGRRVDQPDHGVPALGLRPKLELVSKVGLHEAAPIGALFLPHNLHLLVGGAVLRAGFGGDRRRLVGDGRFRRDRHYHLGRSLDDERRAHCLAVDDDAFRLAVSRAADDPLVHHHRLRDGVGSLDRSRGNFLLEKHDVVDGVLAFLQIHDLGVTCVHLGVTLEEHPLPADGNVHVCARGPFQASNTQTLDALRTVALRVHGRLVAGDLVAFRSSKACGHAFEGSHRGSLLCGLGLAGGGGCG